MSSKPAWRTAVLVAVFMVVPAAAVCGDTVVVSTGLRTLDSGGRAKITFGELAAVGGGAVTVELSLLDARNHVLAHSEGLVRSGEPLVLNWPGAATSMQVRAVAKFVPTGTPATELRAPSLSFESWNPSASNNLVDVLEVCPVTEHGSNEVPSGPVGICEDGSVPTSFKSNWSTTGPCQVEVLDLPALVH